MHVAVTLTFDPALQIELRRGLTSLNIVAKYCCLLQSKVDLYTYGSIGKELFYCIAFQGPSDIMQFDSDEELEPFQLTGNEFRRGRKQTKEEKIYGMWAESDSDEESSK